MEKEVILEFKRVQEKMNDLGQRIGYQGDLRQLETESSIGDLQSLMIDTIYNQTLDEILG